MGEEQGVPDNRSDLLSKEVLLGKNMGITTVPG